MPALPVAGADTVTVTCALPEHAPEVTVHVNILALPTVSPLTPEVELLGLVTTPVPDNVVQFPVPAAPRVVVVLLHNA